MEHLVHTIDTEQDIQQDFSIKLNGIPLLKKFSSSKNFKNLVPKLEIFDGTKFYLTIDGGIKVIPYCSQEQRHIFRDRMYELLKQFITYQLINSGIIPFLREIPLEVPHSNEDQPSQKKRKTNECSKMLSFLLFVSPQVTPEGPLFHNDSMLFNILRYETDNDRAVLGSNILFADQRLFPFHRYMGSGFYRLKCEDDEDGGFITENSDGNYDEEYAGKKLSETQTEILNMYNDTGLNSVLMRGLYNSGDTLVLNDMLVKHSSIGETPRVEGNTTITVLTTKSDAEIREEHDTGEDDAEDPYNRPDNRVEHLVSICDKQIDPGPEHLAGRGIVGLFFQKTTYDPSNSNFKLFREYGFDITGEANSISDLEFNINDYYTFLTTLSQAQSENTCGKFSNNGTEFLLRGGKQRKYKRSRKRRKNKRSKMSKKSLNI